MLKKLILIFLISANSILPTSDEGINRHSEESRRHYFIVGFSTEESANSFMINTANSIDFPGINPVLSRPCSYNGESVSNAYEIKYNWRNRRCSREEVQEIIQQLNLDEPNTIYVVSLSRYWGPPR